MENLRNLAEKIYQTNKKNGFWDSERNFDECLALINSELYEALEAHRKDKFANAEEYKWLDKSATEFSKVEFERFIKDTVEDELADTVIRIFDLIAGFKIERCLNYLRQFDKFEFSTSLKMSDNFGAFILYLGHLISSSSFRNSNNESNKFLVVISCISQYCKDKDIDIDFHVREKLKYNATRQRLHGKKY